MSKIIDVLGIGFGPANIALAIALEETSPHRSCLFIERNSNNIWQKEMLFENAQDIYSNIQNNPHRDLVTPRNPRSRYTFINYLFEHGRLFQHLNMDMMMPLRPEYADYITWVAGHFSSQVVGGVTVEAITLDEKNQEFLVQTQQGERYRAKNVVVGTGRPKNIPDIFKNVGSNRVIHLTEFKTKAKQIIEQGAKKIAVVGSSQSAAEIILYLSKVYPDITVHGIMRRFGFPLKDTNPFMSEIYFPEFTELYYDASAELRKRIDKDVFRTNYGAADMDVIEELYKQIYHDKLFGRNMIEIKRLVDIKNVHKLDNEKIRLNLFDNVQSAASTEDYDAIILATGFKNMGAGPNDIKIPEYLRSMENVLKLDAGTVQVNRNYRVQFNKDLDCKLFLNGLCEATHGMGDAGSLSLVSIRANKILAELGARQDAELPIDKKVEYSF